MTKESIVSKLNGIEPKHRVFVEAMKHNLGNEGLEPCFQDPIVGALYFALQAQGHITEIEDIEVTTTLDELGINDGNLALLIQEMVHQSSLEHMGLFYGVQGHKYQSTDTVYQFAQKFALEMNDKTKAYLAFANEFSHGPRSMYKNYRGTF